MAASEEKKEEEFVNDQKQIKSDNAYLEPVKSQTAEGTVLPTVRCQRLKQLPEIHIDLLMNFRKWTHLIPTTPWKKKKKSKKEKMCWLERPGPIVTYTKHPFERPVFSATVLCVCTALYIICSMFMSLLCVFTSILILSNFILSSSKPCRSAGDSFLPTSIQAYCMSDNWLRHRWCKQHGRVTPSLIHTAT